jgi:hypothetical protein
MPQKLLSKRNGDERGESAADKNVAAKTAFAAKNASSVGSSSDDSSDENFARSVFLRDPINRAKTQQRGKKSGSII